MQSILHLNRNPLKFILFVCLGFYFSYSQQAAPDSLKKFKIDYGSKGFEFSTPNDKFKLQIQSRFQFRYATPDDQDPVTFTDFTDERTSVFKINRARLKVGGHAYQTWLKYYWEYDFVNSNLLDFRLMIEKWKWLNFKVGQWKLEFTRERRISSGEQQLVDRSIINRPFTVDRQQGVEIYGHIEDKGLLDFNYWLAVTTGTGRGSFENDDKNLMYFGRLQWNFFGRELGFESSDLEIHKKPAGILAISAVTNRSQFTRFSTSGGGSLFGFEDGLNGQYRINQINIETALAYMGFSWQSEFHRKNIIDRFNNNERTELQGYYLQAGYFFHQTLSWWPEPLELAFRYADYEPNRGIGLHQVERSVNANWFFNGHKNKLSLELSHFDAELSDNSVEERWRFRIQWDISF